MGRKKWSKRSNEGKIRTKSRSFCATRRLLRDVAEKNEAELTILSGNAKLDITSSVRKTHLLVRFPGTAIKLMLRTRKDFKYLSVAEWEAL